MIVNQSAPRETVAETIARFNREMNNPELMAARLEEVRQRVAVYERQFGIPSADIHAAIDRGELIETWEVCGWIMDYESLLRVEER